VIDPNETIEGMLRMLGRMIGEEIELIWRPGVNVWPVRIDPAQIHHVLVNLCVNARDAIDGVGTITLETFCETVDEQAAMEHGEAMAGDYVVISVTDDGCGMEPDVLAIVFDPFFTTKAVGQGTGLGLPMIYGIAGQNKGFVRLRSVLGEGSTFEILLPRHGGQLSSFMGPLESLSPTPGGVDTILVVEDEPAILKLAATMLRRQGYTVLPAATPSAALEAAREYRGEIHLLVTDVVMPEMNGRDLATKVKALRPDIKRLFISGYTADVIAHHGVQEKGVCFLRKPFTSSELTARVRRILDDA